MAFEQIKELVQTEKEIEEKLKKTNEEADSLIEEAKKKAREIITEAEDHNYYDETAQARKEEIGKKRKAIEKETGEKTRILRETAHKNLEKTVAFILKSVLGETSPEWKT